MLYANRWQVKIGESACVYRSVYELECICLTSIGLKEARFSKYYIQGVLDLNNCDGILKEPQWFVIFLKKLLHHLRFFIPFESPQLLKEPQ